MNRRPTVMIAAFLASAVVAVSCGKHEGVSPLFVLEELEAASAVKDSIERVERLRIFIDNHHDHIFRGVAYERAFETMAERLGDDEGAMRFLGESLALEDDPAMRGSLQLLKFRHLFERDRAAALRFADTLQAAERSPRLFMMIGYYCMEEPADPTRATRNFLRAGDHFAAEDNQGEAERCFARAFRLDRVDGNIVRRLADLYSKFNTPEEKKRAIQVLKSLLLE